MGECGIWEGMGLRERKQHLEVLGGGHLGRGDEDVRLPRGERERKREVGE